MWQRRRGVRLRSVNVLHSFSSAFHTFHRSELFPYSRVIFYTVITAMVSFDRVSLKKKVIDAPEVREEGGGDETMVLLRACEAKAASDANGTCLEVL